MATHPELQEKLYNEVSQVSGAPSYDELKRLRYTEMVINETLRKFPPVSRYVFFCKKCCTCSEICFCRFDRLATEDYQYNGTVIKAGTLISNAVHNIHHDPDNYPDPDVFDPERFSPENKECRHPGTFIPFGLGPRNCLGMRLAQLELKFAVATLFRKFRFEPCEKTEVG